MIEVAIDAILVLVVVEGIALTLLHRRTGRGPSPGKLWPNLAAGFSLMIGIRLALEARDVGTGLQAALGGVLGCALIAHIVDLVGRWRA